MSFPGQNEPNLFSRFSSKVPQGINLAIYLHWKINCCCNNKKMSNIYHFIHKASQTHSTLKEYDPSSYRCGKDFCGMILNEQQNWRWESGSWIPITPKAHCYPHKMLLFSAAGHCQKADSFLRYPWHYHETNLTPASAAIQKFSNTSFSWRASIDGSHEVSC